LKIVVKLSQETRKVVELSQFLSGGLWKTALQSSCKRISLVLYFILLSMMRQDVDILFRSVSYYGCYQVSSLISSHYVDCNVNLVSGKECLKTVFTTNLATSCSLQLHHYSVTKNSHRRRQHSTFWVL